MGIHPHHRIKTGTKETVPITTVEIMAITMATVVITAATIANIGVPITGKYRVHIQYEAFILNTAGECNSANPRP